jgi:FkbM family methyltransferase
MKILFFFIKLPILIFSKIIKQSSMATRYLFSKALGKEVKEYYEKDYFIGYRHIEKVIDFAKRYHLDTGYSIVDVGGSEGLTATMFAGNLKNNKVYVFEPIKQNYLKILEKSKRFSNIVPVNKALGNESGKTTINIASRVSSSSIFSLNSNPESEIFSEILKKVSAEEIIISRLESEIPSDEKISILKIDVQGYELEVLKGAGNRISETAFVILEMNNHEGYKGSPKYFELDAYLRNAGLILIDIFPSTHDNSKLVEWDAIYGNSKLI